MEFRVLILKLHVLAFLISLICSKNNFRRKYNEKRRVIALGTILACSIGLGTLSVEAGNENSGYSFNIKKEQGNEYTGTEYRQTNKEDSD
ncbi:DUF2712 domain-containing protein [Bacillus sp. ISL-34]|uniref:DUF2712 domain-containing protein n=1 Tax=Bacillus sp. ISL-34 TaxID=2819121 RepID=UPI001BE71894|nr:DUF2712 domain-containing protein [Bacillus sp. ISL-34]MBT2647750.1 DUF2712 domain-containing protein [Bacillus sp. ISL-34]